jgi:hypothetical protein
MKIVVIGGTGLIGSKLVTQLREWGDEAVPASPSSGVNPITGEGLAEALNGGSRRCNEAPFLGGRGGDGVLRDINAKPPHLWGGRRSKTSCRVVSCGNGTSAHERFLPRKNGPGELDQGFFKPIHNCPSDAVLRIREECCRFFCGRQQSAAATFTYPAYGG